MFSKTNCLAENYNNSKKFNYNGYTIRVKYIPYQAKLFLTMIYQFVLDFFISDRMHSARITLLSHPCNCRNI